MTASSRRGIKPVDSNDKFDIDFQKLDKLHEIVSEQLERVIWSDPGSSVYLAALSGYDLELNKLEARIWGWTEEMERIRGAHGKLRFEALGKGVGRGCCCMENRYKGGCRC